MHHVIRRFSTQKLPLSQLLMKASQQKIPSFDAMMKDKNVIDRDVIDVHRALFPFFIENALTDNHDKELSEVWRRFEWTQYYNEARELYPSLLIMHGYKILENPKRLTLDNLKLISMLAWAFEVQSSAALMIDDMIDDQKIRWQVPCWYRISQIGLSGINDIVLMRLVVFKVLRKFFDKHPSYPHLIHLLCLMQAHYTHGLLLDNHVIGTFMKSRNMSLYTIDMYKIVVRYKSYECVVKDPILALLHFLGQPNFFYAAERSFSNLGYHIQVANDVHDCFGKYENYGRPCKDISEGKLSWVIATAFQHANERQRSLLERNYGKVEDECQNIVKEIYKEIDIISKFEEHKEQLLKDIDKDIKKGVAPGIEQLLEKMVNSIVNYVLSCKEGVQIGGLVVGYTSPMSVLMSHGIFDICFDYYGIYQHRAVARKIFENFDEVSEEMWLILVVCTSNVIWTSLSFILEGENRSRNL